MKITIVATMAAALLLAGCGGGDNIRADAARVKAMGVSLQTMSKNLSKEGKNTCNVSHKKSGWLSSIWTNEETFTAACDKDPYDGAGEYDENAGVGG